MRPIKPTMGVKMKSSMMRMVCRMLIVSLLVLPFQTVQAGLIGTDQALTAAQVQAARAAVSGFLSRADVAGQLQASGLSAQNAKDRVAALTDTEVSQLAGKINGLPAGATGLAGLYLLIAGIVLVFWISTWKQ